MDHRVAALLRAPSCAAYLRELRAVIAELVAEGSRPDRGLVGYDPMEGAAWILPHTQQLYLLLRVSDQIPADVEHFPQRARAEDWLWRLISLPPLPHEAQGFVASFGEIATLIPEPPAEPPSDLEILAILRKRSPKWGVLFELMLDRKQISYGEIMDEVYGRDDVGRGTIKQMVHRLNVALAELESHIWFGVGSEHVIKEIIPTK